MKIAHTHRNTSGVSIIEVLIVVAIAAILTGIAIPAFNVFIGNTRTSTIANEFVSALNLARSEALKRGQDVYVCRSSDGTSCAASGAWGQGWLVADGDDKPIRVREGLKDPSVFEGHGEFEAKVIFQSNGMLNESEELVEADDYFKIDNMGKTMCIYVNNSGRIRTSKNC
jgi:type IV fimbrial biogenesis protein FimT